MSMANLVNGLFTLVQFLAPALCITWADRQRAPARDDARGDA